MNELAKAAIQFACEATIYIAQRIRESVLAQRPMHDDPLPAGYTPSDEFTGYQLHAERSTDGGATWTPDVQR
jgi:hypothetical protein